MTVMAGPRTNMGLLMAALTLAVFGVIGFFRPVRQPLCLQDRNWALLHFYDGRVRLFWIHSPDRPITVDTYPYGPHFRVKTTIGEAPPEEAANAAPVPPPEARAMIRVGDRRSVPDFGGRIHWSLPMSVPNKIPVYVTYIRLPVWLPVAVLMISPILWVRNKLWLTRYRSRRNECVHCGYSLLHLPEPRCPECGTAVELAEARP